MKLLIPHIALAGILTWVLFALTGWESTASRLLAVTLGMFTLSWPVAYFIARQYFYKLPRLVNLILFFIKELVIANLNVAYDVLTPTTLMRPCIVAFPLEAKTDYEITILANMISLTPGTLSLDLSKDKKYLFVHAISFKEIDVEEIKSGIKNGFEKKLLAVTR